jgi:hypothetical protein
MPGLYDIDRDDERYSEEPGRRPPRPIARQSDNNLAVKILAIIGGVLVVVVLVCGGLAYSALSSFKQSKQRMEDDFAKVVEKQQEAFEREQKRIWERQEKEEQERRERREKEEQERKEQQDKALEQRNEKIEEKRKATQLANSFIADAKAGRNADAYAMTSAAYRKRVSQEQFAELTREYANTLRAMQSFRSQVIIEQDLDPPFAYSDTKPTRGGFLKVEVTVVKEGDAWKVDRFFIGAYDPFQK